MRAPSKREHGSSEIYILRHMDHAGFIETWRYWYCDTLNNKDNENILSNLMHCRKSKQS